MAMKKKEQKPRKKVVKNAGIWANQHDGR